MSITAEQIVQWIIAIMPSLLDVVCFVAVIWKVLKEFRESKQEIFSLKELTDARREILHVQKQLKQALDDNAELKKLLKELLTKVDRIQRK